MDPSRRNALQVVGAGITAGMAGCLSSSEHLPVVFENNHAEPRLLAVSVTSPRDDPGFVDYFQETWKLEPGDERTYEDAITLGDDAPEFLVLAMLDDETTGRHRFSLSHDLDRVVVSIEDDGEIGIETRTD